MGSRSKKQPERDDAGSCRSPRSTPDHQTQSRSLSERVRHGGHCNWRLIPPQLLFSLNYPSSSTRLLPPPYFGCVEGEEREGRRDVASVQRPERAPALPVGRVSLYYLRVRYSGITVLPSQSGDSSSRSHAIFQHSALQNLNAQTSTV